MLCIAITTDWILDTFFFSSNESSYLFEYKKRILANHFQLAHTYQQAEAVTLCCVTMHHLCSSAVTKIKLCVCFSLQTQLRIATTSTTSSLLPR